MPRFLFRFGYCTPDQWKANEAHGWDDESTYAFFIVAETSEAALSWGCEVAELFCQHEFEMANWLGVIPSWKEANFAFWLESDPGILFTPDALEQVPVVAFGVVPDLSVLSTG